MKVTLKKVTPDYKNKFVIVVNFMHGDADAYTDETYVCKNEADFIRVMSAPDGPQDPGAGGDDDEYRAFYKNLFKTDDFIPTDITCDDYPATIQDFEGFYYDEAGNKFEATLS